MSISWFLSWLLQNLPIVKYLKSAVVEIFRVGNIEVDTAAARDMTALHKNHHRHQWIIEFNFILFLTWIDLVIITAPHLHSYPQMYLQNDHDQEILKSMIATRVTSWSFSKGMKPNLSSTQSLPSTIPSLLLLSFVLNFNHHYENQSQNHHNLESLKCCSHTSSKATINHFLPSPFLLLFTWKLFLFYTEDSEKYQ